MSTSELRRGPGWWMDLDGQWNPPEEWPEANPPLPGWTRGPDGLWSKPETDEADQEVRSAAMSLQPAETSTPGGGRPVPETPIVPTLASLREPGTPSEPSDPRAPGATQPAGPAHSAEASPGADADRLVAREAAPPRQVERRTIPDRRATPTPGESALSFAEATANLSGGLEDESRLRRQGLTAALLAAVTASMLAAGLVLLLLLL